jgi:hypothetical protein
VNPIEILRAVETVLVIDWPSKEVPELLTQAGATRGSPTENCGFDLLLSSAERIAGNHRDRKRAGCEDDLVSIRTECYWRKGSEGLLGSGRGVTNSATAGRGGGIALHC